MPPATNGADRKENDAPLVIEKARRCRADATTSFRKTKLKIVAQRAFSLREKKHRGENCLIGARTAEEKDNGTVFLQLYFFLFLEVNFESMSASGWVEFLEIGSLTA